MKISFAFCYNLSWWALLSPVISYVQRLERISHFVIILEGYAGNRIVYEAIWPRFRRVDFLKWSENHYISKEYCFEVPSHLQSEVYEWLESQNKKLYPFSQLIFILFTAINKSFNKISHKWVLNGNKWLICTELGSRFVERFFIGILNESHDRIDLTDMISISEEYKLSNKVWK